MTRIIALLFLLLPLHAAGPVRVAFDSQAVDWQRRCQVTDGNIIGSYQFTHTMIASSAWMGAVRAAGLYPGNILRANLFCGISYGGTNGAGDSASSAIIGGPSVPIITNVGFSLDAVGGVQQKWLYRETGANGGIGPVLASAPVYFDTGAVPSTVSSWQDDAHIGVYMMGEGNTTHAPIGVTQGANTIQLATSWTGIGQYSCIWGFVGYPTVADTSGTGFYLATRTSSAATGLTQYKNGLLTATATSASGTAASITTSIYVLCERDGSGLPNYYITNLCGGYTIGRGLTAAQQLAYYNAWQQFQTLLGRQK